MAWLPVLPPNLCELVLEPCALVHVPTCVVGWSGPGIRAYLVPEGRVKRVELIAQVLILLLQLRQLPAQRRDVAATQPAAAAAAEAAEAGVCACMVNAGERVGQATAMFCFSNWGGLVGACVPASNSFPVTS